ncbi:MAG TPA: hypothetical protein VLA56_12090, partial [Pseudomonadales bacterium]|nr:hypothetical protein [Pseudomonadales bacterium]
RIGGIRDCDDRRERHQERGEAAAQCSGMHAELRSMAFWVIRTRPCVGLIATDLRVETRSSGLRSGSRHADA